MDNGKRNNLECEIVCDLLPLYHDGIVSETTKAAVEQHISECDKCRSELKSLQEELPSEEPSAPVTRKRFVSMMRSQKRRRILWTGISVVLVLAILAGAYFGQLQLPIFDVPEEEITVHRVYRYETEEGYKFFLLYSAPHYDYMRLHNEVSADRSAISFDLKKPLIGGKNEETGACGSVSVYACGWEGNDSGGRDFFTFDRVSFAGEIVWTEADAAEPVPEYVYVHEAMQEHTGEVTGWLTGADEGYVGAVYADGRTVIWDLDGNVISNNDTNS